MAPRRHFVAAHMVRRRQFRPMPPRLTAVLDIPAQDSAVLADLAALPAATRAALEADFAVEARTLARALGERVAAGEGPEARRLAHALAGCAAAFGKPRLAALARLAAQATSEQDQPTARAALAALAEALPSRSRPHV